MRSRRPFSSLLGVILLASVAGCANPAKDKPEAAVSAPRPAPAASAEGTTLTLGPESTISFVGSKVTGQHDGGFKLFKGVIRLVDGDPEQSTVEVTIDASSLWADNEKLTGHLKSPDFFAVEEFPMASFKSTSIARAETGDGYTVTGNLDLHGVTKSITFPAQITVTDSTVRAQAEFFIKRFDFGVAFPGKTDDLIRDEVVIRLDLHAG